MFFFLSNTTGCCGFYNPRSERSKDDKHITSLHITTPGDISLLEQDINQARLARCVHGNIICVYNLP